MDDIVSTLKGAAGEGDARGVRSPGAPIRAGGPGRSRGIRAGLKRYWALYLLFLPVLVNLVVYRYYPILTQFVLPFKNYRILDGIWGSPWGGLSVFRELTSMVDFGTVLRNTLFISVMRLAVGFVPPIFMAILMYDIRSQAFKRTCQTFLYLPHFLSWVVIYSLVYALFTNSGLVNQLLKHLFGVKPVDFLLSQSSFLVLLFGTEVWKNAGFGTILYMAALADISSDLFDAAKIDGAGPLQRIAHVMLPGIKPVVIFLLTLSVGRLLKTTGTEQILLFYSPATYDVADVVGTWVYRQGLLDMRFELGAALGLFESAIGFFLLMTVNKLSVRFARIGLW